MAKRLCPRARKKEMEGEDKRIWNGAKSARVGLDKGFSNFGGRALAFPRQVTRQLHSMPQPEGHGLKISYHNRTEKAENESRRAKSVKGEPKAEPLDEDDEPGPQVLRLSSN
jgi:hypothetical protein